MWNIGIIISFPNFARDRRIQNMQAEYYYIDRKVTTPIRFSGEPKSLEK